MTYTDYNGIQTSPGHLGWQPTIESGLCEIYVTATDIVRAPVGNCIDLDTGCRIGRSIGAAWQLAHYGSDVVIGTGFVPTKGA